MNHFYLLLLNDKSKLSTTTINPKYFLPSMIRYSINDLEKITGIKAHTIRIWEKRYNVVNPQRTDTNIRFYNDTDLKKLLNISTLNKHGFKISEIIKMDHNRLCDKIIEVSHSSSNYESHLNNLVISMIELDEDKFEKILSTAIIKLGFEKTITNIVFPFLEKVGLLWQIGTINPAQEHFISNLIRHKLIIAIDGQLYNPSTDAKTFILYLPENEWHELGLLFYYYLIKKAGHKVIYLGQSVPLPDVLNIIVIRKADYIITYFVSAFELKQIPQYLKQVSEGFEHGPILISGMQAKQLDNDLPSNIRLLQDANALKDFLNKI